MVTQWEKNEVGQWRGWIVYLSDNEEYDLYRFQSAQEQSWYDYITSYFY